MNEFKCLKCGECCKQRYLCIYYTELDKFNLIKNKAYYEFNLIPFRFFIDESNQIIIDIIYRSDSKPCPFLNSNNLCSIENEKFLACKKFPIATWLDMVFLSKLGFNRLYFDLDYHCNFLKENKNFPNLIKNYKIEAIFKREVEANFEDHKIWTNVTNNLKKIKKNKKFQIIIDHKFRKRHPKRLKNILKKWINIPVNKYLEKF